MSDQYYVILNRSTKVPYSRGTCKLYSAIGPAYSSFNQFRLEVFKWAVVSITFDPLEMHVTKKHVLNANTFNFIILESIDRIVERLNKGYQLQHRIDGLQSYLNELESIKKNGFQYWAQTNLNS